MDAKRVGHWEHLKDSELLGLSADEPEAFGELFDRHWRTVFSFFVRRTFSAELAGELAAETFAKAFASRRRFKDVGTPATAWLLGIAQHELKKWLRRRRIDASARRKLGVPATTMDDESLERIEALIDIAPLRAEIQGALSSLTPAIRDALVLRVGMEMPYTEVAERLGCSVNAARVRVTRGLTQVANMMEGHLE